MVTPTPSFQTSERAVSIQNEKGKTISKGKKKSRIVWSDQASTRYNFAALEKLGVLTPSYKWIKIKIGNEEYYGNINSIAKRFGISSKEIKTNYSNNPAALGSFIQSKVKEASADNLTKNFIKNSVDVCIDKIKSDVKKMPKKTEEKIRNKLTEYFVDLFIIHKKAHLPAQIPGIEAVLGNDPQRSPVLKEEFLRLLSHYPEKDVSAELKNMMPGVKVDARRKYRTDQRPEALKHNVNQPSDKYLNLLVWKDLEKYPNLYTGMKAPEHYQLAKDLGLV